MRIIMEAIRSLSGFSSLTSSRQALYFGLRARRVQEARVALGWGCILKGRLSCHEAEGAKEALHDVLLP